MNRLMQSIATCLIVLLLTMPAVPRPNEMIAQDGAVAKVVLNAPSSARVGELVRLDASGSSADSFKWLLVPESVDFEVYAEGKRAVFSARTTGEFLFVLAVAKDGEVDVITWKITVIGPPDAPAADASVGDWVVFWLWELNVTPQSKLALADNFDRIASLNLVDAREWIYETSKSNREVLMAEYAAWEPFLKKLGGLLGELADSGQLTTPEDHARIWKEIAAALRKG